MTSTRAALLAVVSLMWLAAAATAQQTLMASDCDKWIAKINSEVGVRVGRGRVQRASEGRRDRAPPSLSS